MNKKFLVKETYCDDNWIYFQDLKENIEANYKESLIIGFNSDFLGINTEISDLICKVIDAYYYDIEMYYKKNYYAYLYDTLKPYKKIDIKTAYKIKKVADDYNGSSKCDFIAEILSIMFKKNYNVACLRGCGQGDWIKCIYDTEKVSSEYLNLIEAVMFNTGIEIQVSCEKVNIDEIDINNTDGIDCYYDYIVDCWNIADKKKTVAENIGCSVDDVYYCSIDSVQEVKSYKIKYKCC